MNDNIPHNYALQLQLHYTVTYHCAVPICSHSRIGMFLLRLPVVCAECVECDLLVRSFH